MIYDRMNVQMDVLRRANLLGTQLEKLAFAGGIQRVLRSFDCVGGLDAVVSQLHKATALPNLGTTADAIRFSIPRLNELRVHAGVSRQTLASIAGWQRSFFLATEKTLSQLDLQSLHGTAFRGVLQSQMQMRPVMEGLLERFSWLTRDLTTQPLDRIVDSLAGIRTIAAQLRSPQLAIEPALEVTNAYATFCHRQMRYAQQDDEGVLARRLAMTDLAGSILDLHQAAWEKLAPCVVAVAPPPVTSVTLPANVFSETNRHLSYLYRHDSDADVYEAFESCETVTTTTSGCTIVSLVYEINECGAGTDGTDIFKPTNKTLRASSLLSSCIATDEVRFGQIVDGLYNLLYEGSGNAGRLTDRLLDDDLDTIWLIKRLRTGLRHDVNHGRASDVKRKRKQLGEDFTALCGRARPVAPAEWRKAQTALYDRVVDVLYLVLSAVSVRQASS